VIFFHWENMNLILEVFFESRCLEEAFHLILFTALLLLLFFLFFPRHQTSSKHQRCLSWGRKRRWVTHYSFTEHQEGLIRQPWLTLMLLLISCTHTRAVTQRGYPGYMCKCLVAGFIALNGSMMAPSSISLGRALLAPFTHLIKWWEGHEFKNV